MHLLAATDLSEGSKPAARRAFAIAERVRPDEADARATVHQTALAPPVD